MQFLNGVGVVVPFALASQQIAVIRSRFFIAPLPLLALITVWGAAWALPFYIPPGIVALQLGGKDHSAMITNIFGAVGYLSGAVFTYLTMKLGKSGNWFPVLMTCALGNLISMVTMDRAMNFSES